MACACLFEGRAAGNVEKRKPAGQTPAAEQSILMAVRADQARAVEIINSNQQLIAIADPLFRRLRAQQQRPSNPFAPIR